MHRVVLAVSSLLLIASAAASQGPVAQFDKVRATDFAHKLLSKTDLAELIDKDDSFGVDYLGELRATVFGRHGRVFKEPALQKYLTSQRWYRANTNFTNGQLNSTERKNLDLIRGAEAEEHGAAVRPGDLRFWMARPLNIPKARFYTSTDLRIMEAEVEAVHGKIFQSEPLLQKYFEDRYWYSANAKYNPSNLTSIERKNIAVLRGREKKSGSALDPGTIFDYDRARIPSNKLTDLSLQELRLARNAIYAMRGYRFKTGWLRDYFGGIEWYVPSNARTVVQLTTNDHRNIAAILTVEKRKHDELSSRLMDPQELAGLYVEDLTKLADEIPARHGKPFKVRAIRDYFLTFPWYKPDRKYTDARLSKIERLNLVTMRQAMKEARSQFDMEEG